MDVLGMNLLAVMLPDEAIWKPCSGQEQMDVLGMYQLAVVLL